MPVLSEGLREHVPAPVLEDYERILDEYDSPEERRGAMRASVMAWIVDNTDLSRADVEPLGDIIMEASRRRPGTLEEVPA